MTGIRRTPDAEVIVKNAYLCIHKRNNGTTLVPELRTRQYDNGTTSDNDN